MKFFLLPLFFLSVLNFTALGQCDNGLGSSLYTKDAVYYCHQYVKAALVGGFVDLSTGIPISNEDDYSTLYSNVSIASDPDFIQVYSINEGRAIVPVHYGNKDYHSAIVLDNGIYASTPNESTEDIYTHQNARTFTSACPGDEEYYAPIPHIKILGPTSTNQGTTITFTLTNNGQPFPSFIQLHKDEWVYDPNYFSEVPNTKTSTSITLTAKNVSGSSDVKYNLVTGCNGTDYFRIKTVNITPNCSGTLNGGPLYTFNTISGSSNQVEMYLNSWTWVKTSGDASWNTSNGGKNMNFTIHSGCVSFNAYNASCNLTFTFCKYSSYSSYTVIDGQTFQPLKEGRIKDQTELNKILDGLPAGEYIINVEGHSTRYVKTN